MSTLPAIYQALFARAQLLHRSGRVSDAVPLYQEVAHRRPNNPAVQGMLGAALMNLGRPNEARRHLERAIKLSPRYAQFHHDLALTFKLQGKFDRAHASLDEAIKLSPRAMTYRAAKAELCMMAGEHERALELLQLGLSEGRVQSAVALLFAKLAPRFGRQEEALGLLNQCLAKPGLIQPIRVKLLFALGELYDGMERHKEAMEAFVSGNVAKNAQFDAGAHTAAVSKVIAAWSKEAVANLPRAKVDSELPVFVLGMPRSGTTLIEQVLAGLPGVQTGGEMGDMLKLGFQSQGDESVNGLPLLTDTSSLTAEALTRQARAHSGRLQKLDRRALRVIDKMPLNFLVLGLIALLFPKARVVHCVRDPRDTCLSCYFHLFTGSLGFAYDLKALGWFYHDYERLMAHWRSVLDIAIMDVVYEDFVADPETGSRRLAEFLGVTWDSACLRFHESDRISLTSSNLQVQQPVYTSAMQRWRAYEAYLQPLFDALENGPLNVGASGASDQR